MIDCSHEKNIYLTVALRIKSSHMNFKAVTMRQQFIMGLFASLILTFAGSNIFAQYTIAVKTLTPVTITSTHTKVPEKVWESFLNYFSTAESYTWYELNNKFLVH